MIFSDFIFTFAISDILYLSFKQLKVKDKEMNKEITISQTEIFNYEVKTINEDTIWQN